MNTFKTTLLLTALTVLVLFAGMAIAGPRGLQMALVFAALMNLGSYWFSDKIVLAMHRAKPLEKDQDPQLHEMVESLCARSGLPKPRLFLLPSEAPNAFATGRDPKHAAVAITHGLRRLMSREELEGVIAHELAHVRNRDILIASIVATLAGAIMVISHLGRWALIFGGFRGSEDRGGGGLGALLGIILAPIAAVLIQMAISRSREYQADATAAEIVGYPNGLASALVKLDQASKRIPMQTSPVTSHMFIVAPLWGGSFRRLFSTHPPVEERVRRLLGR
ncbi:MAG: zinc metalloprotease HtpX [Acidobacteriota bacterium]